MRQLLDLGARQSGRLVGPQDPQVGRQRLDERRRRRRRRSTRRPGRPGSPAAVDETRSSRPAAGGLAGRVDGRLRDDLVGRPALVAGGGDDRLTRGLDAADDADSLRGSGCFVWIVGMTMAAPTPRRMTSVPTRKIRPRTRSRISRTATRPTSPSTCATETAADRPATRLGPFLSVRSAAAGAALRCGGRDDREQNADADGHHRRDHDDA